MAITLNGSTGISTPGVTNAGNETITGTLAVTGAITGSGLSTTLYPLVSGTAVASTSGTSIDFTGIPSWVKRITVVLSEVSTTGSGSLLFQLGDSGGIENTGYASNGSYTGPTAGGTSSTAGYILFYDLSNRNPSGQLVFTNISGNTWVCFGVASPAVIAGYTYQTGGTKTLSATLDRIRITTTNGTDTFDAGSINILYE